MPILTVVSNIGEDVQYRCLNKVYDVKSVSMPDTILILGKNYWFQITETGFTEQFEASHRKGPASICLKISARTAQSEIYRMISLSTHLFSHLTIPLNRHFSLGFLPAHHPLGEPQLTTSGGRTDLSIFRYIAIPIRSSDFINRWNRLISNSYLCIGQLYWSVLSSGSLVERSFFWGFKVPIVVLGDCVSLF